jgi:hypothetical protein
MPNSNRESQLSPPSEVGEKGMGLGARKETWPGPGGGEGSSTEAFSLFSASELFVRSVTMGDGRRRLRTRTWQLNGDEWVCRVRSSGSLRAYPFYLSRFVKRKIAPSNITEPKLIGDRPMEPLSKTQNFAMHNTHTHLSK